MRSAAITRDCHVSLDPTAPFKPDVWHDGRNQAQQEGERIPQMPAEFGRVLEVHAVNSDHEHGRDTHDRCHGQDLDHMVLLDADKPGGGVLQELDAARQACLKFV